MVQDSLNADEQPVDSGVSEEVADATDDSAPVDSSEVDKSGETTDGKEPTESISDAAEDSSVDDDDDDEFQGHAEPIEEAIDDEEPEEAAQMQWYILKVQSNREKSICDGLKRRVKVEGLDEYFGEIMVPTEDVAEFKNAKRRVVKRKLYPGYIVAHMILNEDTWFVVRETPGIGDFTGSAGKPTPMLPEEVDRIVKSANPEEEDQEQIKTAIPFKSGDRVRIKEGTFENFEGDVEGIDEANGRVTVIIKIFDRSTPVELEHWQIEQV